MKRMREMDGRLPGMQATRQWERPELSEEARAIGEARRRQREEIARIESEIAGLECLIRRMNRRLLK